MNAEQRELLTKADRALTAARLLVEHGLNESATSEAYYAMFYAAKAALLQKGLSFSRHSAVLAAFGREFVKSGLLDQKLHGWLIDSENARIDADYGPPTNIPEDDVVEMAANAEIFLREVRTYLETQ